MQQFDYQGESIFFEVKGSGEPIVLLHGFLEDSSIWKDVSKTFSKSYKIIAVDLPCHGKRRFKGNNCSMTWMAEITQELLKEIEIQNPLIIGHSMGGYVGLELMKLMPMELILLHSNFWEDPEQKKKDRSRVIDIVKKNKDLFIQEAIPGLFAPENHDKCKSDISNLIKKAKQIPATEIAAATAGLRDRSANYEMMEIGGVTLIHGELDPIITNETLAGEMEKLDHKPLVDRIIGCGHMSIWEAPEILESLIKKALKSRN